MTDEAPDVQVTVEDRSQRWQGKWYPTQGDKMDLQIGYAGEGLLDCGEFQVDELELNGPPDTFKIRGMPTYITPPLRTSNSAAYETTTLLAIANTIAGKYGFTVVGLPADINVTFQRVTQNHETDLAFLKRIAGAHNYIFSIRAMQLVFYSLPALELRDPVATIARTNVEKFEFKGQAHFIYRDAMVSYQDPTTKTLITGTATSPVTVPTTDTLKVVTRVENGQQAKLKAESALHANDKYFTTGRLTVPGNVKLVAGANLVVAGFGVYDGKHAIDTARHKLDRATGYTTEIEIRKLISS